MVRDCPPDKRDLRDWDAIRTWAAEIGMELSASVTSPADSSLQ